MLNHSISYIRPSTQQMEVSPLGGYLVSDKPITSSNFTYCYGVVLSSGKKMGLMHKSPGLTPDFKLEQMVKELIEENSPINGLCIYTAPFDLNNVRNACKKLGIYLDKENEIGNTIMPAISRKVNTIPELSEVVISFYENGIENIIRKKL